MKRTRSAALVLALASSLVLSACGDDGGDDPSATPTVTPSATPSQDRTKCPSSAAEVPAFPGVATAANQDLSKKPTVVKGPQPGPTALTYFDLVEGTGPEVKVGSRAELKYVGVLYDNGKEFDSSWSRGANETFDIQACYPGAIVGFSVGPIGMKVGGRRQINIPAKDFGYGDQAQGADIPANSDLIFVVDLVRVDGQPPAPSSPPPAPTSAPAPAATTPAASAPAATSSVAP